MGVEGGVLVSEDAGSLGLNGIMSGDESAQRATRDASCYSEGYYSYHTIFGLTLSYNLCFQGPELGMQE